MPRQSAVPVDAGSPHAFRERRLRLAIVSSAASKASGMAAQVMALGLVAHSLGTARYASYLAITASVAWASLLGFGFLPALTARIARAVARRDRAREIALVSAGMWIAVAAGGVLLLLATAIAGLGTDGFIRGISAAARPAEVRAGLFAALAIVAVHFLSSASTAIRAGYQESHVTNRLSTVANVAVIAGAWAVATERAGIGAFVVAVYAPFTLLFLFDLGRIFRARPYLWPIARPAAAFRAANGADSLFGLFRVTCAMQLYNFLINSGMVVFVSHFERSTETAEFGSLMRFVTLATSVISLLATPLLPAVADAVARAQMPWVRRNYRRAVALTLGVAGLMCFVLAAAGPQLFALWLGRTNAPPRAVCVIFGLYLVVSMSNLIHYNFVLALGGAQRVGLLFVTQGVLGYGLAVCLLPTLGNAGVGLALLASSFALTGWILPRSVKRQLGAPPTAAALTLD